MRRLLLSVVLVAAALYCAGAQDIILLRNGDELKAVVKEISPEEVRYTAWPEGSGPLLTLSAGDIFRITFQNGETQMFGSPATDGIYEIGDIYDRNGVKGIVVHTTDGGRHGLIMSLISPFYENWKTAKHDEKMWCSRPLASQTIGMTDDNDGMNNLRILAQAIEANGLSWDDFPAFKLCVEMGGGWYLPAINEVEYIVRAMNGGSFQYDVFALNDFNTALVNAGGTPIGIGPSEDGYDDAGGGGDSGSKYHSLFSIYKMIIPSSTEYKKMNVVKCFIVGDEWGGAVEEPEDRLFMKTWCGKNNNKGKVRIIPVHKF